MVDKKKLNDMLDSLIDKKDEQAQVHFHNYLEDKMKDVLRPEDAFEVDGFGNKVENGFGKKVEAEVKDDKSVTKD